MIHLSKQNRESDLSFWSLFGKRILSRSGDPCGRVVGVQLQGASVRAFSILNGLDRVRIAVEYVQNLELLGPRTALILNVDPFYILKGRRVYDPDGRRLGRVIRVIQIGESNDFEALYVRKHFFSRTLRIRREQIEVLKKNIILGLPDPQGEDE